MAGAQLNPVISVVLEHFERFQKACFQSPTHTDPEHSVVPDHRPVPHGRVPVQSGRGHDGPHPRRPHGRDSAGRGLRVSPGEALLQRGCLRPDAQSFWKQRSGREDWNAGDQNNS